MPRTTSELKPARQIVRAGAGAGKTHALVHKVVEVARSFMAEHGRFPRVVATTFTRKATQELRERLMLKAIADAPDLIDFVNSRAHLSVSTIHGVLDSYLKRHGGAAGIDPSYKVIGGADAARLARQTMRDCLFAEPGRAELLDRFQFERLVDLARRFDQLLLREPSALPYALADFEATAREQLSTLADDLEEASARVREEAGKADWIAMAEGFVDLATRLRADSPWSARRDDAIACATALKKARWSDKNPPVDESTNTLCEGVLKRARSLDDSSYDTAVWAQLSENFTAFGGLAHAFSVAFRRAKTERGELEISDLEGLAMDSARRFPESAAAFASEWDHWLIDEYQDTSPFQTEVIRALTRGASTYVVGDPQQSIYLFRGARAEVFAAKEAEIRADGGELAQLMRNYRSRPELLSFFNDFFSKFDPPFSLMTPNLPEGVSLNTDEIVATFYVATEADKDAGNDIESDEWRALSRRAQDLLAAGAKPEDICVLARTNRDLNDAAEWLGRRGMPTHVHAASGFLERRETLDALSFLKFLANPYDNANTVEVMRSPWFRVPDDELVRMASTRSALKGQQSLWSAIDSDEHSGVQALRRCLKLKDKIGIGEAFRSGLHERGFIDFSRLRDRSGRRESNVWKLVAQLAREEAAPGFNPLAFVQGRMQDAAREGNEEGDAVAALEPDRINLMTIHASKGLQFRHVLLPRMGQSARLTRFENFTFDEEKRRWAMRVPLGESLDFEGSLAEKSWLEKFRKQELLEHARVLYVAMTRAKDTVYLSWTQPAKRDSWASLINWPLEPGVTRHNGYSTELWAEAPEPLASGGASYETSAPRDAYAPRAAPRVTSASVTDLLETAAASTPTLRSTGDLARRMRVSQEGVSMHRLMELLQNPSQDQLAWLAKKWFPDREGEALRAIELVQAMRDPPLLELIRDGYAEWAFAFREGATIVEGQIDLWGRDSTGCVWIVDYKSGSPERRAQAFTQMSLYALALRKAGELGEGERAHLAAIYPFSGKAFVEVEPDPTTTRAQHKLV